MIESENSVKLSDKAYWDDVLADQKLPRINTPSNYNYKVTMDFIRDVFKNKNYKTLFEVGCGSSGWLPYFAKQYGLTVSGVDYSEIGCKIAEKNLQLLGINHGEIICQDIFDPNWAKDRGYDVIFSYGVIEHFENPKDIIKIFRSFTNPGGTIITLVPNLNGLNGWLTRYFMKEIYDMHRVITREQLKDCHRSNNLTDLKTNYAGTFSLTVIPWPTANKGILKQGFFLRAFFLKVIYAVNLLLTSVFKYLPDLPSKYFSPYIISIAKIN
jgi:2-polyprenyl-3-methyl-5-hydroxy-6-metoxy-1,4-benzoquinol methylase